jgi:hypothetical protein
MKEKKLLHEPSTPVLYMYCCLLKKKFIQNERNFLARFLGARKGYRAIWAWVYTVIIIGDNKINLNLVTLCPSFIITVNC